MVRLLEQCQFHKQLLVTALQLLQSTPAILYLLEAFSEGGIQGPMDQEPHTRVVKLDLAITET